jgi:hypothetical protein
LIHSSIDNFLPGAVLVGRIEGDLLLGYKFLAEESMLITGNKAKM